MLTEPHTIYGISYEEWYQRQDAAHRKRADAGWHLGHASQIRDQMIKKEAAPISTRELEHMKSQQVSLTSKARVLEFPNEACSPDVGPHLSEAYDRQHGADYSRKGRTDSEMAKFVARRVSEIGCDKVARCDIGNWDGGLLSFEHTVENGGSFLYGLLELQWAVFSHIFPPAVLAKLRKWDAVAQGAFSKMNRVRVRNEGTRHSGDAWNSYGNDCVAFHVLCFCIESVYDVDPLGNDCFIFLNSDDWIFAVRGMTASKDESVKMLFQSLGLSSDLETVPLSVWYGHSAQFCSVRFTPTNTWPVFERLTKLFVGLRPGHVGRIRSAKALSFLSQWRHVPLWAQVAEAMVATRDLTEHDFELGKLDRLGMMLSQVVIARADDIVDINLCQVCHDMRWPLPFATAVLALLPGRWQCAAELLENYSDTQIFQQIEW